jgi:tetratricopeptide (TPR) repeat protein
MAPDSSNLYWSRAFIYGRLGDFGRRDDELAKAADLAPENAQLQAEAAIHLSTKNSRRARPYAEQAIKLDPKNALAHLAMARSFHVKRQEHLTHLNRALQFDPQSWKAHQLRAVYYSQVGRLEDALGDIDRSLALKPNEQETLLECARIRTGLGRFEEAERYLLRALELNPNRAVAFADYGNLRTAQKRFEDAVEQYNQAINREAGVWYWHKSRAYALFRIGRFEESLADLNHALEIMPNDLSTLGWIPPSDVAQCPNEDFRQGMLELMAAAIAHPATDKGNCYLSLTKLLKALGKKEQALRDLKAAGEQAKGNANFQFALGHCYRELSLDGQAVDCYAAAIELEPSNAHYWNFRGLTHFGLGNNEDARKDFTKAIEYDPKNAVFWSNRAGSNYGLQAYQQTIDDASMATELEPTNEYARRLHSRSLIALEQWPEAIDSLLSNVNSSDPIDEENEALLALAYAKINNDKEAIDHFLEATKWLAATFRSPTHFQFRDEILKTIGNASPDRFEKFINALDQMIERTPDDKFALEARAHLYLVRNSEDASEAIATLIDGLTPSRSWRSLRIFLARDLASWPEIFKQVVAKLPDDKSLYLGRAQHHVLGSRWAEALTDYRNTDPTAQVDNVVFEYAAALVRASDRAGYSQVCRQLSQHKTADDASSAYIKARTCSISPSSDVEPEQLVTWAKEGLAESRPPWQLHVLGLAHYRAGHLQEAIEVLNESNRGNWSQLAKVQNGFVLAMAHFQAGRQQEAQQWLETSLQSIEETQQITDERLLARMIPVPDWIGIELLSREAKAVIDLTKLETEESALKEEEQ